MILEFIQKALLKNEKSLSVLIKDDKLKKELISGREISKDMLDKVFSKETLKRKDFTRLEEIIKIDLDDKIDALEETPILFDLISEDFKRYDKQNIINRLLKKEYLYITGKTLYEHLINKKENSLEIIKQNRLLLFLDIPYKDWNSVENLSFEKYFRIASLIYTAVFIKNSAGQIHPAQFMFNDQLENAEFTELDVNLSFKNKFTGKGTEYPDYYRFDLEDTKRHSSLILFFGKSQEKTLKGNIILSEINEIKFISNDAIFIKVKDQDEALNTLSKSESKSNAAIWLYNNLSGLKSNDLKRRSLQSILEVIAGQYICYTIAKEKDRIRSQVIELNKDCTVHISSSTLHSEYGFATISDSEKILQIHFHFEEGEYKYKLFLQLNNNDSKSGRLQGIVCGINRFNEPFAERVYLVRIDNCSLMPEDYEFGSDKLIHLLEKVPELISVFLGKKNDFCTDFQSLHTVYEKVYLPKLQNIERIAGVFNVFSYDSIRTSIRKSVYQILPNGVVTIKVFEKGQSFSGKAEILEPDCLIIKVNKSLTGSSFHGNSISLLDGFDIDGIHNFIAFFTGKNEKNELVTIRQVFIKSELSFESSEAQFVSVNSKEYDEINAGYQGVATFLTGTTNNCMRTDVTVNHSLRRKIDFGQVYFESACYSAVNHDKTRALQLLQNAFLHGFKNREVLKKEIEDGDLKLLTGMINIESLKSEI